MDGLGTLVRARRHELGWSQEQLAAKVGASRAYISQIESGNKHYPRKYIDALAAALDIPRTVLDRAAGRRAPSRPTITDVLQADGGDIPPEEKTWAAEISSQLSAMLPELEEHEIDFLLVLIAMMMQRHGHLENVRFDLAALMNLERMGARQAPRRSQRRERIG